MNLPFLLKGGSIICQKLITIHIGRKEAESRNPIPTAKYRNSQYIESIRRQRMKN
jgi:hypothetical protein